MPTDEEILYTFAVVADTAETLEQCFQALSDAVEALGFNGLVYTSIPLDISGLDTPQHPVFIRSEGFDPQFLAHYQSEGFAAQDFTIKRVLERDLSVLDWWKEHQRGGLTPDETEVLAVARYDYQLNNGLSIPTLSTEHHIAGASVVSDQKDHAFQQLLTERLKTLQMLIHLFHNRVHTDAEFQQTFYTPLLDKLTEKERFILKFIATGNPIKAIDRYHDISPAYASHLRAQLYKKLGVRNINQLNYILGVHHILEMI